MAKGKPASDTSKTPARKPGVNRAMALPAVRLLPVTIFVAVLMLSVRVNDIWRGFSVDFGSVGLNRLSAQQPPPPGTKQKKEEPPPPPALANPQPAPPPPANAPVMPASTPAALPTESGEQPTFTQNEIDVLQKLSERREGLDARSRELDVREGILKAAESRIDKKVTELKGLETSIQGLLKKHDEQEDAQMRSLVKIYENMKPKDAAKIFEQLDMAILLDVIERMKEQKVAPIMAEMDPSRAKALTAEMANRRQIPKPGTEQAGG